MMKQETGKYEPKRGKRRVTWVMPFLLIMFLFIGLASAGYLTMQDTKSAPIAYEREDEEALPLFPVGVDPKTERVIENPKVDAFFNEHILALEGSSRKRARWVERALGQLALMEWYQNLASPSSRLLVILPGERKEEVVAHFGKILAWNEEERQEFLALIEERVPEMSEGKFFPGKYTVPRLSKPEAVADIVNERFEAQILSRYGTSTEAVIPLQDALTIASLLEREAYDFDNMREVSGVIWNRLFVGMNLQIDATLQYVKGERPHEPWWPQVRPEDKYVESPFNTYDNPGLPPAPIANPSAAAVLAALNPRETECLFYFHDREGDYHCAKSYEEHVTLLKQYYGRGR